MPTNADYLAALIALRLDLSNVDAMKMLIGKLRMETHMHDEMLKVLADKGYFQKIEASTVGKVETAGWLKDMTTLRNSLVHKRPYGSRLVEQSGYALKIDKDSGLYRYIRPIICPDDTESDVLDLTLRHYKEACSLFFECAQASGYNLAMLTLTDKDIVSVRLDD